jgi:Macrocin-O-methyltransferase (TylF)
MKFEKSDQKYLEERKKISEKYGDRELWSIVDHWGLYCGISNLARSIAVSDIVRENLSVPGHIAEFGSWRGANLLLMAKLVRIFGASSSKMIHSFDSFAGLTEFANEDGKAKELQGSYKGTFEELKEIIDLYEMSDEVILHRGLIEETLPAFLEKRKEIIFSCVYCDTDLYTSTSMILNLLHPRLSKGGVFVLDEWNYENFPGEGIAVNEFLQEFGDCYSVESIKNSRQPSLLIRKIRM